MAQSYSGTIHREYDGQRYSFRTATIYNTLGAPGTIVTNSARTTLQLDLGGLTGFVNVAERNPSGGWTFTENAGAAIKQDLTRRGPGSLTTQLDNATVAALKTNARITDAQARQALDISQNITGTTALVPPNQNSDGAGGGTNPPPGSSAGGSSSPLAGKEEQVQSEISKGQKARTQYASSRELIYPIDYTGNDYMTIEMLRYVPETNLGLGANPNAGADAQGSYLLGGTVRRISERVTDAPAEKKAVLATVTLPIPAGLQDGNLVNWNNQDLNAVIAYAAGSATRVMGSGLNVGNQLQSEVRAAGNIAEKQGDALKTIITSSIVGQLIGGGGNPTLTRSTGAVINPNSELLFSGPQLRNFAFSFKMTPRSEDEASNVRKIIRTLKQGMSVKRGVNSLFLASPNIFRITFYYVKPKIDEATGNVIGDEAKKHPYLPTLKLCALQNMSVNYMPDGSYMTYGDGSMVGYDMTLSFGEIEPIFDEDYDKLDEEYGKDNNGNPTNSDAVIGY